METKFVELKQEYEDLKAFVVQHAGEEAQEEFRWFFVGAGLQVWGKNQAFAPDYEKALSVLLDETVSMQQIMTAMVCCSETGRILRVPVFYKKMIERDQAEECRLSQHFLEEFNQLLVSLAYINGDFTLEEANAVTQILDSLAEAGKQSGVHLTKVSAIKEKPVTDRKEDSYLRRGREPEEEKTQPSGTKPASIRPEGSTPEKSKPGEWHAEETERKTVKKENIKGGASEETLETLMEELDGLVGLENVKQDVHSLMNFIKIARLREQRGMKVPTISYHLVFTGNPGTGKTTVARLVARLYYHMGILPKRQLVEADRSSLVAGYLGQTALKTQSVIQEALGGVLFIDEAYSLAAEDDSYGKEAIETLLKAMEDHRGELVVIVAGYDELMHRFIASNPGLASRFSKYSRFQDYTGEELFRILQRFCRINGYSMEPEAAERMKTYLNQIYEKREEHFGNARTVRNLFEKFIHCQADRIAVLNEITNQDLEMLSREDIENGIREESRE